MTVKLSKEQQEKAIRDIQYYFSTEMDQELGNLASDMLLEFFLKEIGPMIYNDGLNDAKAWFTSKLADLDIDFMLLEKE